MPDYQLVVISDCCADRDQDFTKRCSSDSFRNALKRQAPMSLRKNGRIAKICAPVHETKRTVGLPTSADAGSPDL